MATHLITWNPLRAGWDDAELAEASDFVQNGGRMTTRWSCSNNKSIEVGDRIFVIRLGVAPKGIFASGYVIRGSFEAKHWDEDRANAGATCRFIEFEFDRLLDPLKDRIIDKDFLQTPPFSAVNWSTQASGIRIADPVADELEKIWRVCSDVQKFVLPDEARLDPEVYVEGAVRKITVNAFERNAAARDKCIELHQACCFICKFDFGKFYGPFMDGYIHVHHLRLLSQIREGYIVDPAADLIPVCPNCHAALHRKNPPYTPEELRDLIAAKNT